MVNPIIALGGGMLGDAYVDYYGKPGGFGNELKVDQVLRVDLDDQVRDVAEGGHRAQGIGAGPTARARAAHPRRMRNVPTGAQLLVTANPGCLMQIGAGLRAARLPIRVAHPVELLDESYRRAGLYQVPA